METKGKGEMCAHPSGQVLPKKIIYLSERQGAVSPYYVWPHSSIEVSFGQEGKCGNEGGGGATKASNWKTQQTLTNRAQVFSETATQSTLALTDAAGYIGKLHVAD